MDLSPPNVPFREKICLPIPLAPNPGHASELQGEFGMPSLTQQKMVKRCQEPLVETSSHKRGHQLHRPLSLKKQGQQPPQNLTASPATFENCSFPPVCRPWLQDVSALKHWPPWLSPVKALTQHSSTVHIRSYGHGHRTRAGFVLPFAMEKTKALYTISVVKW